MVPKRKNPTQSGFPKQSMMRRFLLTILLILVVSPAWAVTNYYVDPNWAGSHTGAASTPWLSLAGAQWTTISTTLAADDVTVYFSARLAASDADTTTTTDLEILRNNSSTHRVTLDGMSQYNTSESSPSWVAYSGSSRFRITTDYPINSNNTSTLIDRNYVTIRGFKAIANNGQILFMGSASNLIIENNDLSSAPAGVIGPGVMTGKANPDAQRGSYPSHIIIRNNVIHDTRGECIYIHGTTADPPGTGSANTGDDILIQGNTIRDCGRYGGQGDGIDVKDGLTNLRIINNVLTWPSGVYSDNCAIIVESADLIDGNYVEAPQKDGIYGGAAWNNTFGRSSGLIVRNNIVVNINTGPGHRYAFEWEGAANSTVQWSNVKFYNNTVYSTTGACLILGSPMGPTTAQNNIFHSCGGNGIIAPAGVLTTHDNNIFFNITGSALLLGSTSTSCASIATVETNSLCADPKFVNTSAPYAARNFTLRASSPANGSGVNLSARFTDDYAGLTRTVPWGQGALKALSPDSAPPVAPTGLAVF